MNITKLTALLLAACLMAGATAAAQSPEDVSPEPVAPGGDEPITISPEQIRQFLAEARLRRLRLERQQVAIEIDQEPLFDAKTKDEAIKQLESSPKNTWEDNAQRMMKAYGIVAPKFAKAMQLHQQGNHQAAIDALQPIISRRDTNYFAAAKRYLCAEALVGAGRLDDAIDAYLDLIRDMPDRFSFSALVLMRSAETYEKMHRRYYAMSLYRLWVDSFGLLDEKTAQELTAKADKIEADYRDPLGTIAKKMGQVKDYFQVADSGRDNQGKQREILEQLDDLIATAEEQSQGQGQGQGQGKGEGEGEGEGKGKGKGKGKGAGQGSKSGPASGLGIPSSPATSSVLVGGESPRPQGLSEVRPSDGTDEWGKLSPREREEILEVFKEEMPERYQDMLRDYYESLAKPEARQR